jgi:ribonuclease-3
MEVAQDFILSSLESRIEEAVQSGHHHNFKSVLQQIAQRMFAEMPSYAVLDEKGPDHAKCFEVGVTIGGRKFGACWGPNKKKAEQDAALAALEELDVATVDDNGEVEIDF